MKWRCSSFVLIVGAISLVSGCCRDQGKTSVATAKANTTQVTPLPIVQLPPPAALQAAPPQALGTEPQPALAQYLAFDRKEKDVTVTNGTSEAHFSFNLTNISSGDVTINGVQTSCGCTVAKLPSQPWKLSPNDHGEISATMQLAGVPAGGNKTKTLTVNFDKGSKVLIVKANVLPEAKAMSDADRAISLKMAQTDRQAVFRGDCARCHVAPGRDAAGHDKMGQDLYTAVCGICHNSEHQASFVPNLNKLTVPTNADFWRTWIMHGKPGTLMPAFSKAEGGILSDDQINSLTQYLAATIPSHSVVAPPPPQSKVQ
jgi:cytochrome c553